MGRPAVPRLPGRRRRPREAVVLLVPRPRPRPHRRQRLQGHGRPDADLRPEARQRRRDRPERPAAAGPPHGLTRDGSFDVDYDIPLALYDCRLDDGVTPHKDAHNGNGETHPEWWGKTYFRHFPNHGFVGDIFTVNGTAYPVLEVKRRKYRLRFLDASISRIYDFKLMHSSKGPKAARDLGYTGDELQGQYRLPTASSA